MNPENKNYRFDEEQLAALEKLWKVSVSKDAPILLEFRKALKAYIEENWETQFKQFGKHYDEKYINNKIFVFLNKKIEEYILEVKKQNPSNEAKTYHFGTWQLQAPDRATIGRIFGIYKGEYGNKKYNLNYLCKTFLQTDWFSFELQYELHQIIHHYPEYVVDLAQQWLLHTEAKIQAQKQVPLLLMPADEEEVLEEEPTEIVAIVDELKNTIEHQELSQASQKRFLNFIFRLPLIQQLMDMRPFFLKHWAEDALREKKAKRNRLLFWGSTTLVLLLVGIVSYWNTPKPPFSHIYTPAELEQIQFKILKKDIGINQASFTIYYDFGKLPKPDTIEIAGTGWLDIESNPRYLTKVRDTVQVLFYKPINHIDLSTYKPTPQVLKRILMPVRSTGWIAWVSGNNPLILKSEWYKSYRTTCKLMKEGILHYPTDVLSKEEAAYYHTNIVNHQDFGIKGEACSMEVRLKNPPKIAEGTCMGYGFQLEGEENPIHFGAIPAGCSFWLGARVGETVGNNARAYVSYEQGKPIKHNPFEGDFSGLTPPASITNDWHTWKIKIAQGKAYYYLNEKLVYQMKYQGKIGRILSININFKGSGWVDWVRLRNEKEEEVYFEDFEDCAKPAKVRK